MQIEKVFRNSELVVNWFGEWPSFHDSEVVAVRLDRASPTLGNAPSLEIDIHLFKGRPVAGKIRFEKHCVVTFGFSDVLGLRLEGFNHQNVVWDLQISETGSSEAPYRCELPGSFGVDAAFDFSSAVILALVPGLPSGSVYSSSAKGPSNST